MPIDDPLHKSTGSGTTLASRKVGFCGKFKVEVSHNPVFRAPHTLREMDHFPHEMTCGVCASGSQPVRNGRPDLHERERRCRRRSAV